ncbi:MAG: hypothetical protein R3B70_04430 [Polyangiaceae bacterium]
MLAHGAAYRVAPAVFTELGADVTPLGVKPQRKEHQPRGGALHLEHLKHEVLKRNAQIGIALDGDADRVIMVDEKGEVVDGDAVMAMCALRMLRHKKLPNTDRRDRDEQPRLERAMSEAGARRSCARPWAIATWSRRCGRVATSSGGEQSGHLVFLEHATTGDGIVRAAGARDHAGDRQAAVGAAVAAR